MKQLTILALMGLLALGILACGESVTAIPTATPYTATVIAQATLPPPPADTPVPEPTEAPPATAEPTATPETTTRPEPTATAAPTATAEPTAMPVLAATLEPTVIPEPAPTTVPVLPIAADMAPLGDNLRFVAYLERATQTWLVYDADGNFRPEDLPLPPGIGVPDASDIGDLTELTLGQLYTFVVHEGQTAEFNGNSIIFYEGGNLLQWK